jgi:hypothetical protein
LYQGAVVKNQRHFRLPSKERLGKVYLFFLLDDARRRKVKH